MGLRGFLLSKHVYDIKSPAESSSAGNYDSELFELLAREDGFAGKKAIVFPHLQWLDVLTLSLIERHGRWRHFLATLALFRMNVLHS